MHREEKVTELPQLLRCERCHRYVSRIEVVYRKVMPGKCKCGGQLKLIEKSVKKSSNISMRNWFRERK